MFVLIACKDGEEMNEKMIKKIVSVFIKKSPESIDSNTIIDSSVIQGSVLFHRMISRVNDFCKIEIDDYNKIKNFKDLLEVIKNKLEGNNENRN